MSSLPVRERILQQLAERLGAVRGLEGYDLSELPLTIMVEGDDTIGEPDYDLVRVSMTVTIARGVPRSGLKTDLWYEEANFELAQMILDAYGADDSFGGLVDSLDYAGGGVGILTDGAQGYTAQISLQIHYAFIHGNPFTRTREV